MSAAPVTLRDLQRELVARCESVASRFNLDTKAGDQRAPVVFEGWLRPKKAVVSGSPVELDADQFPFLIVRPSSGSDSQPGEDQTAGAAFEIVIGTYGDDEKGWHDALSIIDAFRLSFGAEPVLAGTGFEHTGPLDWDLPRDQARPQWLALMTTNWTLPRPRRVEALNPTKE